MLQIDVNGPKTSRAENQGFSFQSEKSRRGETCKRSSEQRKCDGERQRKCQQQLRECRDSCAFMHEPHKTGKGKKRPRSPSPTGSAHLNSKGVGKGSDDGGATGTPTSGKANRLLCTNFKKRSCQRGNSCNHWHVPECPKFKAPADASLETRVHANTQLNLLRRRKISNYLQFTSPRNDDRQMQLQKNLSYDKTQLGPAHGVIQARSQCQRHPNAPTFEDRSIERTSRMEEMARTSAWVLHNN